MDRINSVVQFVHRSIETSFEILQYTSMPIRERALESSVSFKKKMNLKSICSLLNLF